MSRCCARKSPQTQRPRASGSNAARPTTARDGPSRSNACRVLSKMRPRPKRGRSAAHVRTLASAADARLKAAPARVGASHSGSSGGAPAEGANGRRVRIIRRVGVGPRGQAPGGLKPARASAASTARQRELMAIVEMGRLEPGAPAIRRASASLTGLWAGRVRQPAKAALRDRTTRAAALAPTSSQDRLAQARAAETGRRAAFATWAARSGRRVSASLTGLRAGRVPQPAPRDRTTRARRAQTSNQDHRAQGRAPEIGRRAVFARRAAMAARRASVASTVLKQSAKVIVENGRRRRGAPAIRRGNASLIDLKAGRVPQPAGAGRNDRTTRAVARAPTSNQDRREQDRLREMGRRALAAARAAKADRRAAAPRQGGALLRGKGRREAPADHAGRRGSRDR
jgi:hypothetical protein